jgi:dTDP-4-dehydrorhamnose 3,5-epimerase
MTFTETAIAGAYLLEMDKREDPRGFFSRAFCRDTFAERGLHPEWAQGNIGFSCRRGTLRGLHYQIEPHREVKMVRCVVGAIFDVVLDLRPVSATFGRWLGFQLEAGDGRLLYVPEGCAHGYLTLMDNTEVNYWVSRPYAPECERGVRWNDPAFAIEWPDVGALIVSEKDRGWPDYHPRQGAAADQSDRSDPTDLSDPKRPKSGVALPTGEQSR